MSPSQARNRKKGPEHERATADYLAAHVDDHIDRRPKTGNKDKGDIGGLRHPITGERLVLECKYEATLKLGTWMSEAETERLNDGAIATAIVHKRHGKGRPEDQWVTMSLADYAALLTGKRPSD
jgi:hypothetical protein